MFRNGFRSITLALVVISLALSAGWAHGGLPTPCHATCTRVGTQTLMSTKCLGTYADAGHQLKNHGSLPPAHSNTRQSYIQHTSVRCRTTHLAHVPAPNLRPLTAQHTPTPLAASQGSSPGSSCMRLHPQSQSFQVVHLTVHTENRTPSLPYSLQSAPAPCTPAAARSWRPPADPSSPPVVAAASWVVYAVNAPGSTITVPSMSGTLVLLSIPTATQQLVNGILYQLTLNCEHTQHPCRGSQPPFCP